MAIFLGNQADNNIYGTAEKDEIYGFGGNDHLDGFFGADLIDGGAGNDVLTGGYGNNTVLGGEGNDRIEEDSAKGHSYLDGGSGIDFLYFSAIDVAGVISISVADPSVVQTLVNGGVVTGFEELWFQANDEGSEATGGEYSDTLWGRAGRDVFTGGEEVIPFVVTLETTISLAEMATTHSTVAMVTIWSWAATVTTR